MVIRMTFRLRSSKFRHVYGEPFRKEDCYEGLLISKNAHDNNFCEVNPKFLAIITETVGAASFLVHPIKKTGRIDINSPKVLGHKDHILDIKWNPFDDHFIASASVDSTVKIWQIPENGLSQTLTDWQVDLHGHTRRVCYLQWHPTASGLLLSAGSDSMCFLWNVETAEPVQHFTDYPDIVYSIDWNYDGSLFTSTCKDKFTRVTDPRTSSCVCKFSCHEGRKNSKAVFVCGRENKIFSSGFSHISERQYALWDMRNCKKPLVGPTCIDSSSGIIFPFYDLDTNIVFLAGKGDGNIRYYEIDRTGIHYLDEFKSSAPQRGLGYMPKRGLDTTKCEIARFYKLHSVNKLCEPVSMIVPRKSDLFQEDIFPPTASKIPSMSANEWTAGANRDPILMSLKDGQIVSDPCSSVSSPLHKQESVPTITTYKTVKRGAPVEVISKKTVCEVLPQSLRNIAKLSGSEGTTTSSFNRPVERLQKSHSVQEETKTKAKSEVPKKNIELGKDDATKNLHTTNGVELCVNDPLSSPMWTANPAFREPLVTPGLFCGPVDTSELDAALCEFDQLSKALENGSNKDDYSTGPAVTLFTSIRTLPVSKSVEQAQTISKTVEKVDPFLKPMEIIEPFPKPMEKIQPFPKPMEKTEESYSKPAENKEQFSKPIEQIEEPFSTPMEVMEPFKWSNDVDIDTVLQSPFHDKAVSEYFATDAPVNSLIKPSKFRASLRSKNTGQASSQRYRFTYNKAKSSDNESCIITNSDPANDKVSGGHSTQHRYGEINNNVKSDIVASSSHSTSVHVKKVWNEVERVPVLSTNDSMDPCTDQELRKAYFRQLEEIKSLKEQIGYKDKRIRQLEHELKILGIKQTCNNDESTC